MSRNTWIVSGHMAANKLLPALAVVAAGDSVTTGGCNAAGESVDQSPGPAEAYERKVELAVLAECLERCRRDVAPRTFDAFRLYVLQKTPATETAATLDMSLNQVYVTRHQLIDRLRREMPEPD